MAFSHPAAKPDSLTNIDWCIAADGVLSLEKAYRHTHLRLYRCVCVCIAYTLRDYTVRRWSVEQHTNISQQPK